MWALEGEDNNSIITQRPPVPEGQLHRVAEPTGKPRENVNPRRGRRVHPHTRVARDVAQVQLGIHQRTCRHLPATADSGDHQGQCEWWKQVEHFKKNLIGDPLHGRARTRCAFCPGQSIVGVNGRWCGEFVCCAVHPIRMGTRAAFQRLKGDSMLLLTWRSGGGCCGQRPRPIRHIVKFVRTHRSRVLVRAGKCEGCLARARGWVQAGHVKQ
mmetsp:Transcript_149026/g.211725  ORF Transcript_149026/g.211725 Transcript_149026/m.211725 type:complete len:212 (+) Transcript_149026:848-1483(+)